MASLESNAVLREIVEVAPGLALFRVSPVGWTIPDFKPGQFTVLGLSSDSPRCEDSLEESKPTLPGTFIRRSYSVASAPSQKEWVEFYITLVRGGVFTPRLFQLKQGDPLFMGTKFTGLFTMNDVPEDKHIIFIGTGTGLAPYMSMTRLFCKPGGRQFVIVHGVRHAEELGYRDELIERERQQQNFHYLPVVSRSQEKSQTWTGAKGYVQHLWSNGTVAKKMGFQPTPNNTHIFLCGNPAMIETCQALFHKEGFEEHNRKNPTGHVHVESYW